MTCDRLNLLYFTFLFLLYGSVACPCTTEQTIDITVGKLRDDGSILYEDILYKREDYFIYNNRTFGCICSVKTCIPKCCPEGYMFVNRSCEFREDSQLNLGNIYVGDGDVRLLGNKTCQGAKANIPAEDIIGIYKNSHVQLTFLNITDVDTYCIEANEDPTSLVLLWCYEGMEDDDNLQTYKFIGMLKYIILLT